MYMAVKCGVGFCVFEKGCLWENHFLKRKDNLLKKEFQLFGV